VLKAQPVHIFLGLAAYFLYLFYQLVLIMAKNSSTSNQELEELFEEADEVSPEKRGEEESATEESSLEFLDLSTVSVDARSQEKIDALRYLSDADLRARMYDAEGLLIDCQHKQWGGTLKSVNYIFSDENCEPTPDEPWETASVKIEFEPKEGETFSVCVAFGEDDPLFIRVRKVFLGLIYGLDKAAA